MNETFRRYKPSKRLQKLFFTHSYAMLLGLLILTFMPYSSVNTAVRAASPSTAKPVIKLIATGGTIAGSSSGTEATKYSAGGLNVKKLVNSVPELAHVASITGDQVSNVGSQDMSEDIWRALAASVQAAMQNNAINGVVITHGTDTIEETAFFLDQLFPCGKPIVLTGSMRPSDATSADGPQNMIEAVKLASMPSSQNRGVLVSMNSKIHTARDIRKNHTENTDAFSSGNAGLLGEFINGKPRFNRLVRPENSRHCLSAQPLPDTLPKVGILYAYAGMDAQLVQFYAQQNYQGIVLAGFGNGNTNKQTLDALAKFAETNIVVRSSRGVNGYVSRNIEINDDDLSFVTAQDLSPQKARILLMLQLAKTTNKTLIQKAFYKTH